MALIRREDVWTLVGDHVMTVRPGSKLEWVIHRYVNAIDGAPEVDAAPVVHARWIEVDEGDGDYTYDCSVCGGKWWLAADTPEANGMKYCPYCGAKMDGERRDSE